MFSKDVRKSSTIKKIRPYESRIIRIDGMGRFPQQALEDTLGCAWTPAYNALRRNVQFKQYEEKSEGSVGCLRCGKPILKVLDLNIDHIEQWLYKENGLELFFDMKNIAFSHEKCNLEHRRDSRSIEDRSFIRPPMTLEEMIKYNVCPRATRRYIGYIGKGLSILNVSPKDATRRHREGSGEQLTMIDLMNQKEKGEDIHNNRN